MPGNLDVDSRWNRRRSVDGLFEVEDWWGRSSRKQKLIPLESISSVWRGVPGVRWRRYPWKVPLRDDEGAMKIFSRRRAKLICILLTHSLYRPLNFVLIPSLKVARFMMCHEDVFLACIGLEWGERSSTDQRIALCRLTWKHQQFTYSWSDKDA